MSTKQIADMTSLPERTVARILSGDTENPYVDTLRRIVTVLGGSLDDIFAESKTVVANTSMVALQADYDKLATEASDLQAENVGLKDKVVTLEAELDRLRLALEHKEEVLANKDEIVTIQRELIILLRSKKPDNKLKLILNKEGEDLYD